MLRAFRSSSRGKGTSIVVWGLLGLLIVGLTGFGLGGAVSGLSSQNVATVGGEPVARATFVRRLFQQIDAFAQQTGQRLTMQQAQLFGIEQQVLSQLVTRAALDGEVKDLGLSVGDSTVRDTLVSQPAFQGLNGSFDPAAYEFFLDRQNLTASEYEEELRKDAARALLERGIADGARMPRVLAETALAYNGERREVRYVTVTQRSLEAPLPDPDEAALRAHYEANPEAYTVPETRQVSYVALTPETLADEIEIDEARLRAAYDAQSDRFNRPERRILDVIAFGTAEEAAEARAAIDAGSLNFDAIAAERGLSADDLSIGALTREELGPEARDVVFGAEVPGILGPVKTDLGPSLYRLNAIIAAQTTSFEDAAADLRAELAAQEAEGRVLDWIDPVEDLLAAGATLEEIAAETALEFGQLGLTSETGEGLAGDVGFRRQAFDATPGEAPGDLVELADGGIAALRLDSIEEPRLRPFEEVRDAVEADWRRAEFERRLAEQAEALKARLDEGRTLDAIAADAGLTPQSPAPLGRAAQPEPGLPAGLVDEAFALEAEGQSVVIGAPAAAYLVRLERIVPVDTGSETYRQQFEQLNGVLDAAFAETLYLGYAQLLTDTAGVSVNEQLIADTLAQYP